MDISNRALQDAIDLLATGFHEEYLESREFPLVVKRDRAYKIDFEPGTRTSYGYIEVLDGPEFGLGLPNKEKYGASQFEKFVLQYDMRLEQMTGFYALELLMERKFIQALNKELGKELELVGEAYADDKAEKYLGTGFREMFYYSCVGQVRSGVLTISYKINDRDLNALLERVNTAGEDLAVRKVKEGHVASELVKIARELL